jgi:hypothetical protein
MSSITTRKPGVLPPPEGKPSGDGEPSRQPSLPMRWGTWVAHHKWWVLSTWTVLFVAAVLAYPHLISSLVAPMTQLLAGGAGTLVPSATWKPSPSPSTADALADPSAPR